MIESVAEVVDYVLEKGLLMPVRKALDPNDPDDFLRISHRLAQSTAGLVGRAEAAGLRDALDELDVDWAKLTPAARARVVDAARKAIARVGPVVMPTVAGAFSKSGVQSAEATRASTAQRYNLSISGKLSAFDQKVIDRAARSSANYVRDEFGRRSESMSATARRVVSAGLRDGKGRRDIADDMKRALEEQAAKRSDAYWMMAAGAFIARSRSYANLSGFAEARITRFTFDAVLDEATSVVCRFMHGKSFEVKRALSAFKAGDREGPDVAQPWLSTTRDADGNLQIYYRGANGARTTVADVTQDATGSVDDVGSFANAASPAELAAAGVMAPPLHGNCRSTIIPDLDSVGASPRPRPPEPDPAPLPPPPPPPPPPAPPEPVAAPPEPAPDVPEDRSLALMAQATPLFEAIDAGPESPAGLRAAKELRGVLRAALQDALPGVATRDHLRPNGDRINPGKAGPGANAYHDWSGRIVIRQDVWDGAKRAMSARSAEDLGAVRRSDADAVRVLLHEELHGMSPISAISYHGIGVGMEEAATEILARRATRRLFNTEDSWKPVGPWDEKRQTYVETAVGSYSGFIAGLFREVRLATGEAGIQERIEDALIATLKTKKEVRSGEKHVEVFLYNLENERGEKLSRTQFETLKKALTSKARGAAFTRP